MTKTVKGGFGELGGGVFEASFEDTAEVGETVRVVEPARGRWRRRVAVLKVDTVEETGDGRVRVTGRAVKG